jgi:hypothetical protein
MRELKFMSIDAGLDGTLVGTVRIVVDIVEARHHGGNQNLIPSDVADDLTDQ